MLIAETPQCLAAPKKLPPIFPCCLSSTICNRPLVPFYFIGSRAANYHYSLALRAFFNIAIDARPAERWVPQWCQTQAAWHGVRFWSFSRTLWIGCARPLQLLTGVCLSIASLVKPQRLYICTAAYTVCCWCAFFFFFKPLDTVFTLSLQIAYLEQCCTWVSSFSFHSPFITEDDCVCRTRIRGKGLALEPLL